jgi:hypothetical protein
MHADTLCLHIDSDGENFYFTPTQNLGSKEGFAELIEKKISANCTQGAIEITNTIYQAISLCQ